MIYTVIIHVYDYRAKYMVIIISVIIVYLIMSMLKKINKSEEKEEVEEKEERKVEEIKDGEIPGYTGVNGNFKAVRNPGAVASAIMRNSFKKAISPYSEAIEGIHNITSEISTDVQSVRNMFYYIRNSVKNAYLDAINKLKNTYARIVWTVKKLIVIFTTIFQFL